MKKTGVAAIALVILTASGGAFAAGDAAKGKRVFNKCKACHSLEPGKKRIGPSLHGVFGRTSGTAKGFKYSAAMTKAKIVWTAETLDKFIEKPRKVVPHTRMAFPGIRKAGDRQDLIAYLKEASKPR